MGPQGSGGAAAPQAWALGAAQVTATSGGLRRLLQASASEAPAARLPHPPPGVQAGARGQGATSAPFTFASCRVVAVCHGGPQQRGIWIWCSSLQVPPSFWVASPGGSGSDGGAGSVPT